MKKIAKQTAFKEIVGKDVSLKNASNAMKAIVEEEA